MNVSEHEWDDELRRLYEEAEMSITLDAHKRLKRVRNGWLKELDNLGALKTERLTPEQFGRFQRLVAIQAISLLSTFPAIIRGVDLAGIDFEDFGLVREHLIKLFWLAPPQAPR